MPETALHSDYHEPRTARTYTITQLCDEFGVTARALRFYEDEGLISPQRIGLSRVYSWRDRARLAWILRGKRVGFSLSDIREMIDLYDVDDDRVLAAPAYPRKMPRPRRPAQETEDRHRRHDRRA